VGTKISGWLSDSVPFDRFRERQHARDLEGAAIDLDRAIAKRGAAAERFQKPPLTIACEVQSRSLPVCGRSPAKSECCAERREEVLRDFDDVAGLCALGGAHRGRPAAIGGDGLEAVAAGLPVLRSGDGDGLVGNAGDGDEAGPHAGTGAAGAAPRQGC